MMCRDPPYLLPYCPQNLLNLQEDENLLLVKNVIKVFFFIILALASSVPIRHNQLQQIHQVLYSEFVIRLLELALMKKVL